MWFLLISSNQYNVYNSESPKVYAHKDSERILGYFKAPKPIIELGKLTLAGRGAITNEKCGTYKESQGIYACECGHTIKINKLSCNSHFCPICYRFNAMTQANKIMIRTIAGKLLNNLRNAFHVVISPSAKLYTSILENVNVYYKKAISILNKYWDGGSIFYHPYRLKSGILEFSPHFHALAISNKAKPLPLDMRKLSSELGMTITIIRSKKDDSIYYNTQDKLLKTIYYELTHSACVKNRKMYRYFGCLSYSKFKTENIRYDDIPVLCQKCEGNIYFIPEFEIKEYHYNEICQKKLDHLYKRRNALSLWNFKDNETEMEIIRLEKLKIIDSIENIRFDKTEFLTSKVYTGMEIKDKLYRIKEFGGTS